MSLVSGTTISWNGRAVMLRGPSGAGKSDLALRLIEVGAVLVADDNTEITVQDGQAVTSPPEKIKGLLEVRGVGIVSMPFESKIPLALVIDLVERDYVPRLPKAQTVDIAGVRIPSLALHAFDNSTPAKIFLALAQI